MSPGLESAPRAIENKKPDFTSEKINFNSKAQKSPTSRIEIPREYLPENKYDLGLAKGDRIHSNSGTHRDIIDIVKNKDNPDASYYLFRTVKPDGSVKDQKISMRELKEKSAIISKVNKGALSDEEVSSTYQEILAKRKEEFYKNVDTLPKYAAPQIKAREAATNNAEYAPVLNRRDRVYSNSGTYRDVIDVVENVNNPHDSYYMMHKVNTDGTEENERLSFKEFNEKSEAINRVERNALSNEEVTAQYKKMLTAKRDPRTKSPTSRIDIPNEEIPTNYIAAQGKAEPQVSNGNISNEAVSSPEKNIVKNDVIKKQSIFKRTFRKITDLLDY